MTPRSLTQEQYRALTVGSSVTLHNPPGGGPALTGKVVRIEGNNEWNRLWVAVLFEEQRPVFHSCLNSTPEGYGYYLLKDRLSLWGLVSPASLKTQIQKLWEEVLL